MYTGCIAGSAEEAIMKEGITLCCPVTEESMMNLVLMSGPLDVFKT